MSINAMSAATYVPVLCIIMLLRKLFFHSFEVLLHAGVWLSITLVFNNFALCYVYLVLSVSWYSTLTKDFSLLNFLPEYYKTVAIQLVAIPLLR